VTAVTRTLSADVAAIRPIALPLGEAAKVLGLSARSLRRLASNGAIPVVRIGHRVLFAVADLDAMVAAKRMPAAVADRSGALKQKASPAKEQTR